MNSFRLTVLPLLLVLAAAVSCVNEKESYKPEYSIASGDWHQVPASGGSVEVGDLALDIPSGTFAEDSKVAVTKIKKGAAYGGDEQSEFYQLTFPTSGTRKELTLRIKSPEPEKMVAVARAAAYNSVTLERVNTTYVLDTEVKDGEVVATIPQIDDLIEIQPNMTVGLLKDFLKDDGDGVVRTKKDLDKIYKIEWPEFDENIFIALDYAKYKKDMLDFLNTNISDVLSKMMALGFEMPSQTIVYVIRDFHGDSTWGYESPSLFSKSNIQIELDSRKLKQLVQDKSNTYLHQNLQQTLIHETLHYVHDVVYDKRMAFVKFASMAPETLGNNLIEKLGLEVSKIKYSDEWVVLSEALATWIEKATGDRRISENCAVYAELFLDSFMPREGQKTEFQNAGYGMGFFIEWLSQKTTNRKIVGLLENQRNGGESVLAVIKKYLADNKVSFFTADDYCDFAKSALTGKIDDRVKANCLSTEKSSGFLVKKAGEVVTASGMVYNFGVSAMDVRFQQTMVQQYKDQPYEFMIAPKTEGKVSFIFDSDANYLGKATDTMPFTLSLEDYNKNPFSYFRIVTINVDNPQWSDNKIEYKINLAFNPSSALKPFKIVSVLCEFNASDGTPSRVSLYADNKSMAKFTSTQSGKDYKVRITDNDETDKEECTFTIHNLGGEKYEVKDFKYEFSSSSVWDSETNPVTMLNVNQTLSIDTLPLVNLYPTTAWWEAGTGSSINYSYSNTVFGNHKYSKGAGTSVGDNCFRIQVTF